MRRWILAAVTFVSLSIGSLQAQTTPLEVLATTSIIADIAKNVGGDLVNVQSLVPVDTDIHAFEPLPSDVRMLENADMLLINGAGLEEFLGRLLENVVSIEPIVVGNGVEILGFSGHAHEDDSHEEDHESAEIVGILGDEAVCEDGHEEEHEAEATEESHEHSECDPHYWENPLNAIIMTDNIAVAFAEADPDNAEIYFANAEAYKEELSALDAELEEILTVIPAERRVLITNHDFLAYFAHRYEFEVLATVIPSVTTLAEPSPQELANLVALIQEENVPVIFAEVGDSSRLAQVVAAEVGQEVQIVSLYSGALSSEDSPAANYLDYMRFNANAIRAALMN